MEKLIVILAAAVMMVSLSMVGSASDHSMIGTMGANDQMMMSSQASCGPGEIYAGEVAWVDPDIHRMMVSGRDGSKIFDVSGIAMKGLPEISHFVTVKYTVTNGDRLVSSVNTIPKRVFTALYVGNY